MSATDNGSDVSAGQTQLINIVKAFDVNDHSTVIHPRNAMCPVLDVCGLTQDDSVQMRVEAASPLLFVHIG
jgi:hypothetical protein